jgi:hypothetical protein
MPFPTTQWGNVGNPAAATPTYADVYTTAPGPNATTPNSADGPVLGNFQTLADGTEIQFLQAVGAIAKNASCVLSSWQNAFVVAQTTAATQLAIAVNDRGNTILAASYCTWFTREGLAFPLVAASTAANAALAPSATAGVLAITVPGTTNQANIVNAVVVGGSQAVSPAIIF